MGATPAQDAASQRRRHPVRRQRAAAVLLALVLGCGIGRAGHGDGASSRSFSSVAVPRSVVAGLAQDREGLLWVGIGNGLARWDGYRLQMVERDAPQPLQRNLGWVRALAAGADGRMWIGSEANGLQVHEPDSDRVQTLGSVAPPHAPVRALAVDARQVWMATLGQGLQRYELASRRFERLPLPDERVMALHLDDRGTLWIGHWSGLSRLPAGARQAETVALPGGAAPVQSIAGDGQGRVWIGLQDGRLGQIDRAGEPRWLPPPEVASPIQALALDADGWLWVGRRTGIEIREPAQGRLLEQLRHHATQAEGLAGDEVTALLQDRDGTMWVGGFGIGLQREQRGNALTVRGAALDPGSPLHQPDIRALLVRRNGELLLASHAGPVARLDAALRLRGTLPSPGFAVEALTDDAQGRLWLAGAGQLQCRLADSSCGQWTLSGGRAHRLHARDDGELLIAMQDGAYSLRPDAALQRLQRDDGSPLHGEVHQFLDDGDGGLWLATLHGLLQRPAGQTGLRALALHPEEGLAFPVVLGLLRSRDGSLWVDTAVGGLHRLLGVDALGRARFDRVSVRHGAVGMPFGANLHEDEQGRIWSQTHVYDPRIDRLHALSEAEGLRIGTPWFFATGRLSDGRLLFGGSRGLLVVQPQAFQPRREAPPLVLTGMRLDGRPHRPASRREGLVVPPGSRGFSVEFAALDFADPSRLLYRYRLVGADPDWMAVDASRRAASYGQLPPGRYQLQLQARRPLGVWGEPGLLMPVTVQAAWWQQPWARLLGLLAGLLLLWGGVQWRTQALRQREARLQSLVDQRTAALREASLTDPLTGLKNRRYLMQRIQSDLSLAQRRHAQQAPDADLLVFLIDLDHFKQLNDELGHVAGDLALQQAAERLRAVFRDSDMLVRWGGEEFLAVAQASRREHAAELAERLRRALADAPMLLGPGLQLRTVTASIGFAVFPPDGREATTWDWNAVLQLTDAALYAAKAEGRNTWVGVRAAPGMAPTALPPVHGVELLQAPGLLLERPPR